MNNDLSYLEQTLEERVLIATLSGGNNTIYLSVEEMERMEEELLEEIDDPFLKVCVMDGDCEVVTFDSIASFQRHLCLNAMEKAEQEVLSQVVGTAGGETLSQGVIGQIQQFLAGPRRPEAREEDEEKDFDFQVLPVEFHTPTIELNLNFNSNLNLVQEQDALKWNKRLFKMINNERRVHWDFMSALEIRASIASFDEEHFEITRNELESSCPEAFDLISKTFPSLRVDVKDDESGTVLLSINSIPDLQKHIRSRIFEKANEKLDAVQGSAGDRMTEGVIDIIENYYLGEEAEAMQALTFI